MMKSNPVILILLFVIVYLLPLGMRSIVIPDETRYAEIPREMLETGNWVVPKLDGLRYFEKPVLGYWLNAVSIFVFGENAFAVRLPSALAVGLSALLIFFIVRKFGDSHVSALLAATAYLTCFEVFGTGTFCVLDSVFSMFITAILVFFFFAWQENESIYKKNLFLALAGFCCGMAFLAKGFIAFVLPVSVIAPFLLWQREWKELLKIWWIPLSVAIVVVLPWCIAVHFKEADYWRYFFWQEHIQRFLNPDGGQHPKPFWYFIPIIFAGALPWTTWLPKALSGLKDMQFKDSFIRFAVCWLVFPFLFFSACKGKLGTYILPCFPPLLILLVVGFLRWSTFLGKEMKFKKELYISAGLMCFIAVSLIFAQTSSFVSFKIYNAKETWKWILLIIVFLTYAGFLIFAARQKTLNKRLICCCFAPLLLLFCVAFVVPDSVKIRKMPGEFLLQNAYKIHPNTILVSDNTMTSAVCWFYKRNDVYLFGSVGELEYGLSYKDASERLIDGSKFEIFLRQHANGEKVVLITTEKRYADYKKELPKPLQVECNDGFVLATYEPCMARIGVNDAIQD